MKTKTTIFIFQLISLVTFSQQEKIEADLNRVLLDKKIGFIGSSIYDHQKIIVPFEYEIEPYGKRNIARYVEIDTLEEFSYANNKIREKIVGLDYNNYFEHYVNDLPYDAIKDTLFEKNPHIFNYQKAANKFFDGGDAFYAVYKNGKYGFIDTTGKLIIPLQYEGADDFKFIGETAKYDEKIGYYVGIVKQNGKYGVINQHNEVLLNFMFDDVIFYHNYEQFGYYEPTYLCMYKGKKYLIPFDDGSFELPDELKKK